MNPAFTVTGIDLRPANPPLAVPHATASGMVATFPMVAIDLHTSAGITGCAYVFTYTTLAAPAVAQLLRDLGSVIVGQPCAPLLLDAHLRKRFRLLGATGLVTMAVAGIDMAAWDALCKANGKPLYAQLGGVRRASKGYAPVGLSGVAGSAREARAGVDAGFRGVKAKIGYPTLAEDLQVVAAMREAVGPDVAIMVDYNQALDVPEAMRRCAALDDAGVAWIEEPTLADDLTGHAQIRAAARTPIQAGENWWGLLDYRKAADAGAADLWMPDAMKVGGITSWLKVAALAEAHGVPLSNHLFPEVSAHLMALAPTASWFEWCDWANPVLKQPVEVRDGDVWPSEAPGIGIEWDDAALARHELI